MKLTKKILKERKSGIGGSECAAVLGKSKWGTPLDIYLSKINKDITETEENESMRDGKATEPHVIKLYEEETGSKVIQPGKIFKNDKYPWLLANVDGIVKDKEIVLEAKSTGYFKPEDWGDEGSDDMPTQYLFQCAHYCIVLDKKYADLAAWSFGKPLRIYHYYRNKKLEQQIIEKTHDFWHNHVLKLIPPDPNSAEDILKLYKKADESQTLVADARLSELAYKDYELKNQIAALKAERKNIKTEIECAMKKSAFLVDVDGTKLIAWTNRITNDFQTEKFKSDNLEQYEQYCKEVESRVFNNTIK